MNPGSVTPAPDVTPVKCSNNPLEGQAYRVTFTKPTVLDLQGWSEYDQHSTYQGDPEPTDTAPRRLEQHQLEKKPNPQIPRHLASNFLPGHYSRGSCRGKQGLEYLTCGPYFPGVDEGIGHTIQFEADKLSSDSEVLLHQ